MHKVLERQLRHLRIPEDGRTLPTVEQWNALLERVGHAYTDADQDRYTLERSIELSSAEMQSLHQKLASERDTLRSIFESTPLGILRLGPSGEILDANPAAVHMLALTRDELVQRTLDSLFDGDTVSSESASAPGSAAVFERRRTRADGRRSCFYSTEIWVRDADGATQFGTVVVEDVTEKKQLETSLRHAQRLESVGRLASGVAHELNTPIQFVNDNTHFLQESFGTIVGLVQSLGAVINRQGADARAQAREAELSADWAYLRTEVPTSIEQTLEGLRRVAKIVQSMKSFAYNDQGEQGPTDLNAVLESTLTVASHELKSVATVSREFGNIPEVVCSRGDLGQVFLNLFVNAAHAVFDVVGNSGSLGTIKVATRRDGDHVVVSVSDTGVGISESIPANLFEPFFTTKEVGRGSGQGLALARTVVVKKHGGALTFESEVGVGTTFHVRLPIQGARAQEVKVA